MTIEYIHKVTEQIVVLAEDAVENFMRDIGDAENWIETRIHFAQAPDPTPDAQPVSAEPAVTTDATPAPAESGLTGELHKLEHGFMDALHAVEAKFTGESNG